MKKFIEEFKQFAMRGNVLDMAVGVIVGGAFNSIVTSLVNDVITPLIAIPMGKATFTDNVWVIGETQITIGNFIDAIFSFLITAFSVFVLVKTINILTKKREAEKPQEPATPKISSTDQLLMEILEELKKKEA